MSRSRAWCFTANIPDDDVHELLVDPIPRTEYMVWQYEEKAHRHIQGYIYWKNARTMVQAKKAIKAWCNIEAHLEKAMGSPQQNKDYCTKDESRVAGPWESGIMPAQGNRSDIDEVWDIIKANNGVLTDEVVDNNVRLVATYGRRFKEMHAERTWTKQKEMLRDLKVIIFFGEPGTGKSCKVYTDNPDVPYYRVQYVKDKEFSTYNGEDLVIFDEFKGEIPLGRMKEYLDRLPINVNVMYRGAMPFKPSKIYITSNYPLDQWWRDTTRVDEEALSRRVTEIYKFTGHYETEVIIEKIK